MANKLKKFVVNLQKSEDAVKKRWLIALTTVSTLLVILVWAVYLNVNLSSISAPADSKIAEKPGLIKIFGVGLEAVSEQSIVGLTNSFVYFNNKFQTANNFTISRGNPNFIWDELEKLPSRPLP